MATTPVRVLSVPVTSRRLAGLGLASVATILVGMVVTAIPYRGYAGEGYSPFNHFVSELGEIAASRLAWAFNLSIVLGGIGLGVFLLLLADRLSGRFRTALVATAAVAGVSGTLVGVFPMDYLSTHRVVSDIFFLTGWLVAGIFSAWLVSSPRPDFPRWLLVPGGAVVTVFLGFIGVYSTYHPVDPNARILDRPGVWSVPALEWVSLLSLLLWFVCVSVVLLGQEAE